MGNKNKTIEGKTHCLNCKGETGFGFGVQPLRHDVHWCSSECHTKFYQPKK